MDERDVNEIEGRLQTLTRLSPPTTEELGPDVLHERATKVRRRSQLALAVPAAALVVVVLAAALAVRSRGGADETVPAGPTTHVETGSALTARDLELLDWVETTVTLRQQLMHEMLLTATYMSSNKSNPTQLTDARAATDRAHAAFEAKTEQVQPDREGQMTRDALKQLTNRMRALPTVRRSVDALQSDAARAMDDYSYTISDLTTTPRSLTSSATTPNMLRGLLNAVNLSSVTDQEAHLAALLTVAVETRFYAAVLPSASEPVAARNNALGVGCGSDASGGGRNCKVYADIVDANEQLGLVDRTFNDFADGERKARKRKADAGLIYDQFKRSAIEDGLGHNDLTGVQQGTVDVPVVDFRRAAAERIDKLITAEREVIALMRDPATGGTTSVPGDGVTGTSSRVPGGG